MLYLVEIALDVLKEGALADALISAVVFEADIEPVCYKCDNQAHKGAEDEAVLRLVLFCQEGGGN